MGLPPPAFSGGGLGWGVQALCITPIPTFPLNQGEGVSLVVSACLIPCCKIPTGQHWVLGLRLCRARRQGADKLRAIGHGLVPDIAPVLTQDILGQRQPQAQTVVDLAS